MLCLCGFELYSRWVPLALLILRFRFKLLSIETGHHLKNCVIIQKYDLLAALH